MGHPGLLHPTLRKEREGWGTLIDVVRRLERSGNSLGLDVGMFLIALEDVGLGDDAFEQAGNRAVDDGQDGPAMEVGQGFVERQVGIEEGRAIVGEQLLNGLIDAGGSLHQLG